ncbi:MAG: T9SS type B sorting domain-containing protein [Chitinophagaceae bacterium]|nr:MAG: T9SS type B sorting domain-containing protein [Chitinophagaceae bacterium]
MALRYCAILLLLFCALAPEAQLISTIAGSGYNGNIGNNGPALCAGLPYPYGICLDRQGSLYLTCTNSIRKVNLATGIITGVAGSDVSGHSGDGGPASAATMQFPSDLCIDQNRNLYISEWGGHYIRKINLNTGIISTVTGTGTAGFSGDGGPAATAQVSRPSGLTCDAAGNLYFADSDNNRVRKITLATGVISTIAGTGQVASAGDGGLAVLAATANPVEVKLDKNNNILFIESNGNVACRLRKIDAITGVITTLAGTTAYAHSGDGGPATAADLYDPSALSLDDAGNIYIGEYDESRIIDIATGIINTIAGTGANGFTGDGGSALSATFHYPTAMSIDANGDLYFADNFNHRIRKISAVITTPPTVTASIVISAPTTAACPGERISFQSTVTNATTPSYRWEVNGIPVSFDGAFSSTTLTNGDVVQCILTTMMCSTPVTVPSNKITITSGTNTPPVVTINAVKSAICFSEQAQFTSTVQHQGQDIIYEWRVNGSATGVTTANFTSNGLANGDQVTCLVIADPTASCGAPAASESAPVILRVTPNPVTAVTIEASSTEVCAGKPVTFTSDVVYTGTRPSYQWLVNGSSVAGQSGNSFTSTSIGNGDEVVLQVTNTGSECTGSKISSLPLGVLVNPLPVVSISPSDTIINYQGNINLRASVSGPSSTFQWTPAAKVIDAASLSTVSIPLLADTRFSLLVRSVAGCEAKAEAMARIYSPVFMPSAFTPNHDGINDVYRIPVSAGLVLKEFCIFDRWGNKVFTTTDPSKGWDGTLGSVPRDAGVFIYQVRGKDVKGEIFLKGTFVLIR